MCILLFFSAQNTVTHAPSVLPVNAVPETISHISDTDVANVIKNNIEIVSDNVTSMEQVYEFCKQQEKPNTRKCTDRDVKSFCKWLLSVKGVSTPIEVIPPTQLNELLSQFIISVRKSDGQEYQPGTLLNIVHSIDRYLKSKKYFTPGNRVSILKDDTFEDARLALNAKRIHLKKQGLGNRPGRSVALEPHEEQVLWDKGVLGCSTPFSLQFTIWFNLTLLMGLRGRDEHRCMKFGDISLHTDAEGLEYISLLERGSKTRDGTLPSDLRPTTQKIYCTCKDDSQKCIVEIWKQYFIHRPDSMCAEDSPMYLQYKTEVQIQRSKDPYIWYKQQPLGTNSLGKFLPTACKLGNIPV